MTSIPEYRVSFRGGIASTGSFEITAESGAPGVRMIGYDHGDRALWRAISTPIPDPLLDLYSIFLALRDADRSSPRSWIADRREKSRNPRRFVISFPVRDVGFWKAGRAESLLSQLVSVLSGDTLEMAFEPISERAMLHECQLPLPIDVRPDFGAVTLSSGGIDSLYSKIVSLAGVVGGRVLAISANTNSRQTGLQRRLVRALRLPKPYGRWAVPLEHLSLLTTVSVPREFRESSYRMRVLGFLAAGAVAAIGMGLDRLVVAENGPGAINLPSNAWFGGAKLNRAMHPETLKLVSELVALAIGSDFEITNVGLSVTKRQMVHRVHDAGFGELIDLTNSCDRFPYTDADVHCGRCSSCLLRALALVDHRPLLERLGKVKVSTKPRMAAMYKSTSMMHYLSLGQKLDRVLGSLWPMEELWSLDPSIRSIGHAIAEEDLIAMLASFRQDIADLEVVLEGLLFEPEHVRGCDQHVATMAWSS